ncbi:hypothetical protein QAD02_004054 [Eretmocerus hayati]|uniref:Uncharacterized protein n=1 Tax=Eretmocerus hayati TaxID=131215 RepID=A0ACC2NNY6_9HYME|nr:hypothetical protein QAD02_004054 [Eretmocerus hayati]
MDNESKIEDANNLKRKVDSKENGEPVDKKQCLKTLNDTSSSLDDGKVDDSQKSMSECIVPQQESNPKIQKEIGEQTMGSNNINEDQVSEVLRVSRDEEKNLDDSDSSDKKMDSNCDNSDNHSNQDLGSREEEETVRETVANEDNASSTTQSSNIQNVFREKCKYGSQCYRLSAEHKTKFSHPGDSDYDVVDDRPECPYGRQCYRKNPQHKLDYKHTKSAQRKAKTTARPESPDEFTDESPDESVDESEYEPSFIDDDEDLGEIESDELKEDIED